MCVHTSGSPLESDLLQELHAAPKGAECEARGKGIDFYSGLYPFLEIGYCISHCKGEVLFAVSPSLPYVVTTNTDNIHIR